MTTNAAADIAEERPAAEAPLAQTSPPPPFGTLPPCPSPFRHPLRALAWLVTLATGLMSLVLLLAILAAIPIVNLLALGTMLEAEGRVVRSGRLRDGFPFAGALPRLGAIVVGTWLWILVVRLVTQAAIDAALIDPGGTTARLWQVARVATALVVGLHLLGAYYAGGNLIAFVRPIRNFRLLVGDAVSGAAWQRAAAGLEQVAGAIQPLRLFSLGLRGFIGTFLWIAAPTLLLSALRDTTKPAGVLLALVGGILLAVVLSWVPFLQARFAADPRLSVFREVEAVRESWRRAPVVMLLALAILYGLSLPLYLFKIVAAPRDAVLFLTPIFILTIYPARLAIAWATHRAATRPGRRSALLRFPVTALLLPLLLIYVFLLLFTPTIDAFGRRALFDHHALLLPTPF